MSNKITLSTLEGGKINGMFEDAVSDALENIYDHQTDISKKRSIIITVEMTPYKGNREVIVSQVKVKTKTAQIISAGQILSVGNDEGQLCLFDGDQGQMELA